MLFRLFRDHIFQLYRGQTTFSQDVFVSPARLVVGLHSEKIVSILHNLWYVYQKKHKLINYNVLEEEATSA